MSFLETNWGDLVGLAGAIASVLAWLAADSASKAILADREREFDRSIATQIERLISLLESVRNKRSKQVSQIDRNMIRLGLVELRDIQWVKFSRPNAANQWIKWMQIPFPLEEDARNKLGELQTDLMESVNNYRRSQREMP